MTTPRRITGLSMELLRIALLWFWFQYIPGEWFFSSGQALFALFFIFPHLVFPFLWLGDTPKGDFFRSPGPLITVKWAMGVSALGISLWLGTRPFVNPLESIIQPEFYLAFLIGTLDIIIISLVKGAAAPSDPEGRV